MVFLLSSPVKLSNFPPSKIQHGISGKIKDLNSVKPSVFKWIRTQLNFSAYSQPQKVEESCADTQECMFPFSVPEALEMQNNS